MIFYNATRIIRLVPGPTVIYFVSIGLLALLLSGCGHNYHKTVTYYPSGAIHTIAGPDGKRHEVGGVASWYGKHYHGRLTANGEKYNMRRMTAAHKTLPFNTVVRVRDPRTRKSVKVRINDRGPFVEGRIIDLSRKAARKFGMENDGVRHVELEIVKWGDGKTYHR